MQALELIDSFGAEHVAAAVVDSNGSVVAMRGDTSYLFPLASVTKLFTAMAVLISVEEKTLGLDDPVGPTGSTVRHLLAHASGLSQQDRKVALAVPGAKRIYSNAGYDVLGDYLEDRAGIPFAEYLHEGVFSPLAMSSSSCDGSPAAAGRSSIEDLSRFLAEILQPTLISPPLIAEAESVQFPGLAGVVPGFGRQDPCDWGLGFEIKMHKSPHWTGTRNSPRSYGHFGQSGTFLLVDPEVGYGLCLLTDRRFEAWAKQAWPQFCDAVFDEVRADDTHTRAK